VSKADKDRAMQTLKGVQGMFSKLGVSSRDGNGGDLPVHFEPDFPNAAYAPHEDGSEELIIGSDPKTHVTFAKADDVLAHEYSHRVVNNVLGLEPVGESGAVNESLADTFAAAYDNKNWTIGETVRDGGLRDMAHPDRAQDAIPTDRGMMRRPANIRDYLDLPISEDTDMGGVHINVGIPNKAASLIGDALGRDTMAKIYIDAVRNYMGSQSGIADTARATVAAATDQFGGDSKQVAAVMQAWQAVGLKFRQR